MELMITFVIAAILASIALSYGNRPLETAKGRIAMDVLRTIYEAQRERCIRNGIYTDWTTLLNENYLLDPNTVDQTDWVYTIAAGGGSGTNNCGAFTATARRLAGRNASETITIDQTGQLNTTFWSP